MGHDRPYACVPFQGFLLLVICAFVFLGCPDPNLHFWFLSDAGEVEHLEQKFLNERVSMTLSNFSWVGQHCKSYKLSLSIKVRYDKALLGLGFQPGSVKAFMEGVELTRDTRDNQDGTQLLKDEPGRYEVVISFYERLGPATTWKYARQRDGKLDLLIDMTRFIQLDGEAVPFDTIRAVERRSCA